MKKEMKFPPNGVDRVSETKRIVAEMIRQKIEKDERDKSERSKEIKIKEANAITQANRECEFGINAIDDSSPRIIGFSPKIKRGKR
jgi:hypothetical protein